MTGRETVFIIAAGSEKDAITDLASALDQLGLEIEHLIREHTRRPYDGFELSNNL